MRSPILSTKNTLFYRGKTAVSVTFSEEQISSDGGVLLLEKIEREHKFLKKFSALLPDNREQGKVEHSYEKMLKQRVFMLLLGYEDANDAFRLKHDPLLQDVLQGNLASQPTISRFENEMDKHSIFKLCYAWIDHYVDTLAGRDSIIIDVDGTDDKTYGAQQFSMFNGYYGHFMYNELFFHDGETGQIIAPVLRPGNSHSNKWYVAILKRMVTKIRAKYPLMKITVRADSGFSCAPFYKLADELDLQYAVGMASNSVLKKRVEKVSDIVQDQFQSKGIKHQHFITFKYGAKSWHKEQRCYSKIESTGKGMNVRHIISNIPDKEPREVYFDFYVKRGEASENRIKEVKNMCFSDRLSNHGFWANFFRLFLSSLAYEMALLIKQKIAKTSNKAAKRWQISNIRTFLLKIGSTIKTTKRRIYYKLSKAFVHQELFLEIITQ